MKSRLRISTFLVILTASFNLFWNTPWIHATPALDEEVRFASPNILSKGTLSSFANKTLTLGNIAQKTFREQNELQAQLQRNTSGQALVERPEFTSEVLELSDAFVLTQSTRFVVANPQTLSQGSDFFKNQFAPTRAANNITIASLKPSSLQGFRDYIQNDIPKAPFPEINGKVQFPFPTKNLDALNSQNADQGAEERLPVEKPSIQESGFTLRHGF
ncbi:MAG: hypothetical protein HYS08_04985 [Chlamydiae bacterium]|nr:hypothetical protein [Chlamydiota bacterium]MBI3267106.1 hypothetical protein [Chlamydiota bacterium]